MGKSEDREVRKELSAVQAGSGSAAEVVAGKGRSRLAAFLTSSPWALGSVR